MTIMLLYENGLITDDTLVIIRDDNFNELVSGEWYCDDVLIYGNCEIESFTWQDDEKIYVDLT